MRLPNYSFLIGLLFLTSLNLYGQNTVSFNLENKETILASFEVPGRGVYVKTGSERLIVKDNNWMIYHFDEAGDLVWKVPIVKDQIEKGMSDYFVGSPYSEYVYHIESQGYNPIVGPAHFMVNRIKDGMFKMFEIKKVEKLAFSDDVDDWFVSGEGLHGIRKDKVDNNKEGLFFLYSWDHTNLDQTDFAIDLPDLDKEDKFTDWWFQGHSADQLYFLRKQDLKGNPQKSHESIDFELAIVALNGTLQKTTRFTIKLKGNKLLLPHADRSFNGGAEISHTGIIYSTIASSPGASSSSKRDENFSFDMYGGIWFDEAGGWYVYGIYDDGSEKTMEVDGMYLQQFDSDGNLLNEKTYPLPASDDRHKMISADPRYFNARFNPVPGKGFVLDFYSITRIYSFDIAPDLSLLKKSTLSFRESYKEADIKTGVGNSEFAPEQRSYLNGALKRLKTRGEYSNVIRYFGNNGYYHLLVFSGNQAELSTFEAN